VEHRLCEVRTYKRCCIVVVYIHCIKTCVPINNDKSRRLCAASQRRRSWWLGGPDPRWKYVGGSEYVLTPHPRYKCHIHSFKTCWITLQVSLLGPIRDERLVSKMEGKTNFSKRLKQFDGLTDSGWLTLAPLFYDKSNALSPADRIDRAMCLMMLENAQTRCERTRRCSCVLCLACVV